MTQDFHHPALYKNAEFEAVLDNVCDRLEDKQVEYSIKRLRELEARLGVLEQELDDFILCNTAE
jgi:hypothetical protein